MKYQDTYFFNSDEALKIAMQQNRWENGYKLQVCYYDGEKIESKLKNLIHLPIDNLIDELSLGKYRLPTSLNFDGLDISTEIKVDIIKTFNINMEHIAELRRELNITYKERSQAAKLDFNEPFRFYLIADNNTEVMQYITRKIANTIEDMGYTVFVNEKYGCEDNSSLRIFNEFNPHITINLNNLNNGFLTKDVFNFIWFQDITPILSSDEKIILRDRDFVYSLAKPIDNFLKNKNIKFKRQNFCIDNTIYKLDENIKREKKIVFIGSSYKNFVPNTQVAAYLIDFLVKWLNTGEIFSDEMLNELVKKFKCSKEYLINRVIPYVVRDVTVLWLCSIKSEYKIEIYGNGWEDYKEIKGSYKGVLPYGSDISKVYNSATFAFAPHSLYMLQSRTFEAAGSGAIPIVYDCRDISDEPRYDEALYYFKTFQDLKDILTSKNKPKANFDKLIQENKYEIFITKIIEVVNKNLKND